MFWSCPVALCQSHLCFLCYDLLAELQTIHFYQECMSPQAIIPPSFIIIPYHPDIVIYHESTNAVVPLELTFPLDSFQHLEFVRD